MFKRSLLVPILMPVFFSGCGNGGSDRRVTNPPGFASPTTTSQKPTATPPDNPVTNSGSTGTSSGGNIDDLPPALDPLQVSDPLYTYSWHLKNTAQRSFALNAGRAGIDLNVETVHSSGIKGAGIVVAVSDNGIETNHEDLRNNFLPGYSKDFTLPFPYLGNPDTHDLADHAGHGTSVTGIIAAQGWNGLGGRGVAPAAKFIGFNLLAPNVLQSTEQMLLQIDAPADVFNYSYGAGSCRYYPSGTAAERLALLNAYKAGVNTRRAGKGAVYLKAAGNEFYGETSECGVPSGWDPNYLGNANLSEDNNYPYTLMVAALSANGARASYSSPGANVWISGLGGEYGDTDPAILTTDLTGCSAGASNSNDSTNSFQRGGTLNSNCQYTSTMNGTSSATPSVAGVVALMLSANPSLTWRDVKLILASTATVLNPSAGPTLHPFGYDLSGHVYEQGWVRNAAGYYFHNHFGFGLVNGKAAVDMAKTYSVALGPVKESVNPNTNAWPYDSGNLNITIPDNSAAGISSTINIRHNLVLEALQVRVTLLHPYIENIGLELTSPSGTKSIITNINSSTYGDGYYDAVFLTNAFLGESSLGNWVLKAVDGTNVNPDGTVGSAGALRNWKINPYGHSPIGAFDQTPPAAVTSVNHAAYYSSLSISPNITFNASSSSDVLRYELSVGTSPGATDIAGWFSRGLLTTGGMGSLALSQGVKYFVNVRVVDQFENVSPVTTSTGWTADTLGTVVSLTDESQLSIASGTSFAMNGQCEPGATLFAAGGSGVTVNSSTCSSTGAMVLNVTFPDRFGKHIVVVTQTDQAGNTGAAKTITFYYVPRGIEQLSLGDNHGCMVDKNGAAKCWGANSDGQLGVGNLVDSSVPTAIPSLIFKTIGAGARHSCAVTTAGGVKCWGHNQSGSLGNGSLTDSSVPVDVTGLSTGVRYLFSGRGLSSCVLTSAGGAKCWGDNTYGQLGDGTNISRSVPVDVQGLSSGVEYLYIGGYSACAKLTAGGFKCWGNNQYGQLGDSSRVDRSTPVSVSVGASFKELSLGEFNTCGLKADGTSSCWGYNTNNQLNSSQSFLSSPGAFPGQNILAHRSGLSFQCALIASGGVECRGLRTSGQTAEGTTSFSTTPNPAIKSQILGSSGATEDLAVGKEHLCFTTTSNGVFCAGSNDYGELGDGFHTVGNPAGLSKATEVLSLAGLASKVTVGTHHSCVLTTGNGVSCWGENSLGQLGDGSNIATVVPISVQGLSFGVSALATGTHHNCVLTSTGGVKCWGRNTSGQLGDGTGISNNVPVDVVGLTSGVSSISVAGSTSCAVLTGGEARCWGRNTNGQIGDGTLVNKTSPVTVSGLGAGVASMAVGEFHNCSLSTLGAVKCWGSDYLCETGSNVNTCNTNVTSPQAVYGLTSGVERISSGNSFSCALMSNKAMRCWGSNASGQLGYGSTSYKYSSFTEVTAANAPYLTAQKLFLGSGTTCLVTAGKTAYCWGANNIGQRADGSADTPLNTMSPIGLLY